MIIMGEVCYCSFGLLFMESHYLCLGCCGVAMVWLRLAFDSSCILTAKRGGGSGVVGSGAGGRMFRAIYLEHRNC